MIPGAIAWSKALRCKTQSCRTTFQQNKSTKLMTAIAPHFVPAWIIETA